MDYLLLFEDNYNNIKCLCTDTKYKCNTRDTFKYCINKKELLFYCPYLHFLDDNYNTKLSLINNTNTTNLINKKCINIIKFVLSISHNFIRVCGSYYMIFTNVHIFNTPKHTNMLNQTLTQFKTNIFTQSDDNIKLLRNTFEPYILKNDIMQLKSILQNWIILFEKMII